MKRFSLMLLVLAFAMFSFQGNLLAADTDIIIKEITGLVQVQTADGSDWAKAEENQTVTSGDKIRSFLESSALLVFPNGGEFRLRENTSLDVKDISQNTIAKTAQRELKLNVGSLYYKIPPKKEKTAEFKIHSSTSIVGITGTEGIITAKGEGKLSENILIEGATYNTDDQGKNGSYQKSGLVYKNDGTSAQLFGADVEKESDNRTAISGEYIDLVKEVVAAYKGKKDEGYLIADAEALIRQAFFYLEQREYDLVKQTAEQAQALLEKAKKVDLPEDLDGKVADAARAITAKEDEGYDVAAAWTLLGKAQWLKQTGEYDDIRQMLTQIDKELALLTEENLTANQGRSFLSHYQDVQKNVLEKELQGFSLNEIKSILRQSQMFYDQGDKARAYRLINEAQDKLALTLKNVSDALQVKITRLTEKVAAQKAASYPTKELELRLDKVNTYLKEENFLKARELVSAIEEGLLVLTKTISAEWQLKISNLRSDVNYKRSIGYTLSEIPGLVGEIINYQDQGDLVNLELTYAKILEELAKLKLPAGFEADWNQFLKQKETKQDQAYNLREVNDLTGKIETAINAGDIKTARLFLDQAKKVLAELKDQEPPKVQVLTFSEAEDMIKVEGYASDNTKVRDVSVNNTLVAVSQDGTFSFNTVANPLLKKLSILAADIEGNISAPVVLTLSVTGTAIDPQANVKNVAAEYLDNTFVAKGTFVPGGTVKIGTTEAVCDSKGDFAVTINPDRDKLQDAITIAGILSEGVTTEETVLALEDKWAPKVNIEKVTFDNNFAPALNVDPFTYGKNTLSVSGQVVLTQMANIEGSVSDLGGEMESLKVEGTDVDIRADGVFTASLTVDRSRKDPSVKIVAQDKSGNVTETLVALDTTWNWPSLKINDVKTFQQSFGKFSKEVLLTADTADIVIVLENSKGEAIVSKRLPVAAVLPPELEIQNIRYEGAKVHISGRTTADGTVSEKGKTIFKEDLPVTKDTVFTLTADYPAVDQEIVLIATNIEGKTSEDVNVTVGPPKDTKAPVLYLSSPLKDKKGAIITGFVEDNSEIAKLTVQDADVEITDQGAFSYKIESLEGLNSVTVVASDIFGNTAKKIVALSDKEKPQISIDTWEAKEGRLIITGKATDNVGIKEVRLNEMPIAVGEDAELAFSYNGVLTQNSQDAVIIAVDLLGNETREGPREIGISTDTTAPTGQTIRLGYGSPVVYASGSVADPAGVKAVYVNGDEVELFDDGTFNIKVNIDVGLPKLQLESPAYDRGRVIIAGKAALGDFTPAKITVESEDLSGNRAVLFSDAVTPYQLSELEVAVNGQVVEIGEDGSFRHEQPVSPGQNSVQVNVQDPFDNHLAENLALEDKKPVLNLEPLEYNAEERTVILSGKAQDEGVGLSTVSVNGIRIEMGSEGVFTYKTTFDQKALNVVAADYIGNETFLTVDVNPPDVWPPVFSLSVSPVPAIIGNPVYVEIAALDSNTRLPEILKGAPVVTAEADGQPVSLTVDGEGANYIATLKTAGLNATLVNVSVQGEDEKGNSSSDVEGVDVFALVEDDAIIPSFKIEVIPSPVQLGKSAKVKVYASEDLKTAPTLEALLPSGANSVLPLSTVKLGEYEASLSIPVGEGVGMVHLTLSGGEDLSGNAHKTTETGVPVVASVIVTELPLNINLIEFLANRFTLGGTTASEAIVRMEAGKFSQDIVANAQGMFRFERPITLAELEEMRAKGPNIGVNLKAHNYAGFESRQKFFQVPLPPLPERGGKNFNMSVSPSPAGQGGMINISVEALKTLTTPPKGFLYLPGGQRVFVNLQGRNVFTAQYLIPESSPLGAATFEVTSDNIRESIVFDIVLSDQWMQRLNKYEFFKIRVSQDPLIIGERVEFFVETMGDLPTIPRMELRLPNGRVENIPLAGSKRLFQGSYVSPADLMPGRAELVLNPGLPEEVRRPYGVENRISQSAFIDTFLMANPYPLIGGSLTT